MVDGVQEILLDSLFVRINGRDSEDLIVLNTYESYRKYYIRVLRRFTLKVSRCFAFNVATSTKPPHLEPLHY